MRRLRRALTRVWRRLWRRPLGHIVKIDHDLDTSRWAEARARFWTELREGEREAEAQRARLRP
jgi:chromosome condensin MukBEF MukE localization factor